MPLTVSSIHLGTPESSWLSFAPVVSAPLLQWPSAGRVVVIAPHPDDEVLAVGGTMRSLTDRGYEVEIIAVTDGEASHPGSRVISRAELAERRAKEREEALGCLGLAQTPVLCLHCPDGGVSRVERLAERIAERIAGAAVCLAPWERDGHPDHDATGIAAIYACAMAGVRLLQYPVWAWHWARPTVERSMPWGRLRQVHLSPDIQLAKHLAIDAYRSQTVPLGEDEPILPAAVLARFGRSFETLFV